MAAGQNLLEADFVVVGAGSAGCVDGGAAERGPGDPRRAAGSRRRRQEPLDPHPARLRQDLRRPLGQLVLRDRTRSRRERPPHLLAARQGAGRLVLDQRHGLHPRPARGFRPLAPDGLRRLVGRRRAALFQARRAPDPRAGCVGTAPAGRSCVSDVADKHPICEAFIRACDDLGYPDQRRFQRRGRRKASATTRRPRATASAARPPSAICTR